MTAGTLADVDLVDLVAPPLVMQAAFFASQGTIDPETVPCEPCGLPVIGHVDQDHDHVMPPAIALAIAAQASQDRDVMDDIAEHQQAAYRPSGKFGPRVSDAGACRRQIWYRERPPVGFVPRTDIETRRAALGGIVHSAGEIARRARYPWKQFEMTIPIPGLEKPGRVDEYDPVLAEVADTKSAGKYKWELVGEEGPTPAMWLQLRIYGYALDALGLPVKTLTIYAINRDTGAEEHFSEPYNPALGLAALDELAHVASAIEGGMVPDRDGNGPSDWRCRFCPALEHCWNTDRAAQLGRHPRSLTLLGETPEDPSIVWAALEFRRIAAARLALQKEEELAQELIEGLKGEFGKDRVDGGVELYPKPHTSVGYKDAYAAVVESYGALAAGDPDAPAPDALPQPAVSKTYKTAVRKGKRKAATVKKTRKKTPAAAAAALVEAMTEGTAATMSGE